MASPKTGTRISVDTPASPLDAAQADASQAGSKSGNPASTQDGDSPENQDSTPDGETSEKDSDTPPEESHWIAIKLEDHEGRPAMHARYTVKLPDGTETRGTLDKDGKARLEPVPAGNCEISFPDIHKEEWSLKG